MLLPADHKSTESSKHRSTSSARKKSVEFYRRVFGFEPIDTDQKEGITDETRLCAMRAGDRSVLLLFKKGATADTNATGAIHVAFGISRSELPAWEAWLSQQGITIELRKTWKDGGEALLPRPRRPFVGSGHPGCVEHLLKCSFSQLVKHTRGC
jgi:catechol 2,3-dioxygenase-like lactoylglutathione lyase family enzyme